MLKEKVKKFMEIGISLKSISTFSGVHYTTLSKWLNDEREMNANNQQKVEEALSIIMQKLLKIFYS